MPNPTFHNLSEEKKERILNAAIKEFRVRNVRESNLSNIVKDAKIARGSIYQYFPSKEDLYIYIFDTLRAQRADFVFPAYEFYKKAPFLDFFQAFYLRDSEFLLMHPDHIDLGQQLYGCSHPVSQGLIRQQQNRYRDMFLIGIEYDKQRGLIDHNVESGILADLCVHFVTDIFIFQSVYSQLTMQNIQLHCQQTLFLLSNGTHPRA